MGDFKEWLSDNLRYFLVGVVVILIIGGSILGLKIYSSKVNGNSDPAVIRKNTEAQTETGKETETKKQTEKETKKQTEKETKKQTEKEKEEKTEAASVKEEDAVPTDLTEEQKYNFSYFATVAGLSQQIASALYMVMKKMKSTDQTSRVGNLIILGAEGSGKSTLGLLFSNTHR